MYVAQSCSYVCMYVFYVMCIYVYVCAHAVFIRIEAQEFISYKRLLTRPFHILYWRLLTLEC